MGPKVPCYITKIEAALAGAAYKNTKALVKAERDPVQYGVRDNIFPLIPQHDTSYVGRKLSI